MAPVEHVRAALRRVVVTIAVAALLAGCGTTAPSSTPAPATEGPGTPPPTALPSPSATPPPAAELYAGIRLDVEQIRGLEPDAAVEPVTLDETQLRTNLTAEFDRENSPAELRLAEDLLITLGLLPAGTDLRAVMLDFQSGQVAGYYSPDKDELYVVSRAGGLGPAELVTYAHEFTHQLQDQRIGLDSLGLDATDQSDRQLARLALVEGDASSVQTAWMLANLSPAELAELLRTSLDPKAVEALTRAPVFVRETALFPYESGLAFVNQLVANGGYGAVNAAFGDPPDSTEQILHPEKYADREEPEGVTIPAGVVAALGGGWSIAGQDTLGELILAIWLRLGGATRAEAAPATAGWGGDRAVILRGPDGAVAVGVVTTWDSAADAAEFLPLASAVARALDPGATVVSDGVRRVVIAMGDRAADLAAALAR